MRQKKSKNKSRHKRGGPMAKPPRPVTPPKGKTEDDHHCMGCDHEAWYENLVNVMIIWDEILNAGKDGILEDHHEGMKLQTMWSTADMLSVASNNMRLLAELYCSKIREGGYEPPMDANGQCRPEHLRTALYECVKEGRPIGLGKLDSILRVVPS